LHLTRKIESFFLFLFKENGKTSKEIPIPSNQPKTNKRSKSEDNQEDSEDERLIISLHNTTLETNENE
jgi:hypothetical protein